MAELTHLKKAAVRTVVAIFLKKYSSVQMAEGFHFKKMFSCLSSCCSPSTKKVSVVQMTKQIQSDSAFCGP